jgi:hypothetical protein
MNLNPTLLTQELVVCALICILKSAPAADVVYEHSREIGSAADHVIEELTQTRTMG